MKYVVDHDYHIHSQLSLCSDDPGQTTAAILQYAKDNGLSKIVVTDHFWDSTVPGASEWYEQQDYAHISKALPLPQDPQVQFLFGCETEMDQFLSIGLSPEIYEKFDFIIVPTTHLHMTNFTLDEKDFALDRRAERYVQRFHALLDADLPFGKVGIAHMTCGCIDDRNWENHLDILDMVSDETFTAIFQKASQKGLGIELNYYDFRDYKGNDLSRMLRPYKIAKQCGCKFYLGSDSHHPQDFIDAKQRAADFVQLLQLEESDKFHITANHPM